MNVGVGGTIITTTSGGDIGIGIQSPGSKLDIANLGTSTTVSTRLLASDSGGNSVRLVTTQNADGSVTFNANAGGNGSRRDIIYQQAGSEVARLDTNGRLGIGTANPAVSLDIKSKTDAIALPQGTTAQRPSGNNPYIRWNTTNSALEVYNGTDWVEIITDYFPSGSVILG